jgi:hypothetical protein
MEWVISTLIALIAAGAAAVQAWVVWKQHRLEKAKQLYPDELVSEVDADYTKLQNLLRARKYKEANQETTRIMLFVSRREKEGWLNPKSIDEFPYPDLRTIDQLWVQNSNRRFGFSIQKEIYNQVGKDFGKFAEQVKWRVGGKWQGYNSLVYDIKASRGHLPTPPVRVGSLSGVSVVGSGNSWLSILSRREL